MNNPPPDEAFQSFVRLFLGFGLFMTFCSVIMVFTQPRDSGEFVISVCNIFIGLALIGAVIIFMRVFKPG